MVKTIKIADRPISYQVLNRKVKYPRLEFKTGGLVIILPEAASNDAQLIQKYRKWIITKTDYINKTMNRAAKTQLVLARTPLEFNAIANKLIRTCSKELGVEPGSVFIRVMRSKWASLSANRNLTLNSLLGHLPQELVAYVIYHELAHLIERRHGARFWAIIRRKYKNHERFETMLFEYWFLVGNRRDKEV